MRKINETESNIRNAVEFARSIAMDNCAAMVAQFTVLESKGYESLANDILAQYKRVKDIDNAFDALFKTADNCAAWNEAMGIDQ